MKLRDLEKGFRFGFPATMMPTEISSPEDWERLKEKQQSEAGQYVFVSVWNLQADLACYTAHPDGTGRMETLDWPDEDYALLVQSVEDMGGSLNRSGWYRCNSDLLAAVRARAVDNICPRCYARAVKLGTYPTQRKGRMQRWRCTEGHTYSTEREMEK